MASSRYKWHSGSQNCSYWHMRQKKTGDESIFQLDPDHGLLQFYIFRLSSQWKQQNWLFGACVLRVWHTCSWADNVCCLSATTVEVVWCCCNAATDAKEEVWVGGLTNQWVVSLTDWKVKAHEAMKLLLISANAKSCCDYTHAGKYWYKGRKGREI